MTSNLRWMQGVHQGHALYCCLPRTLLIAIRLNHGWHGLTRMMRRGFATEDRESTEGEWPICSEPMHMLPSARIPRSRTGSQPVPQSLTGMKLGRVVKSSLRLCVFSEGEFSAKPQGRRGAEQTGADSAGIEGARRNTRSVEMRRGFSTEDTESTEAFQDGNVLNHE